MQPVCLALHNISGDISRFVICTIYLRVGTPFELLPLQIATQKSNHVKAFVAEEGSSDVQTFARGDCTARVQRLGPLKIVGQGEGNKRS